MQVKTFLWTLSLGMVGGAAAAVFLPRNPMIQQAVTKAADAVENAAETARETVSCG